VHAAQATVHCSANGLLGQGQGGVDTRPVQEVVAMLQAWTQGRDEAQHAALQAFQLGMTAASAAAAS
jgi:hypothetical protein